MVLLQRLHFTVAELILCSLQYSSIGHGIRKALGFRSQMSVAYLICGNVGRLGYTNLQ